MTRAHDENQRVRQHGIIDANPASDFPAKETVTFAKAGTYTFYCVVHGPDMKGTITVQ